MQCEKFQIDIQRFLDNDLNADEKRELFEHLEHCQECAQEFEEFQQLHQELLQLPQVKLDSSLVDDILLKVGVVNSTATESQDSSLKRSWSQKYRKYIIPTAAAAVIILALFANQALDLFQVPYAGEKLEGWEVESQAAEDEMILSSEQAVPNSEKRMMESMGDAQLFSMDPPQVQGYGVDQSMLAEVDFVEEDINKVPAEVRDWVNRSKKIFAGQSYIYNGKTYIYVSLGEKTSDDYQVYVDQIYNKDNDLYVHADVDESQSANWAAGEQYPDILVSVQGEHYDVSFNEWQGDVIETWIPEIYGIESIPVFYDQSSDIIKLYSPEPNSTLVNSILIKGIARTYDGSVYYRLVTNENEEIASGFITATRGAPDWGYFEQEIFIDLPSSMQSVDAYIEVYEVTLSDGGKLGTVTLPITLKGNAEGRNTPEEAKYWMSYLVKEVNVEKKQLRVEAIMPDQSGISQPVSVLDLNGVPIIRDITNEKANTVSQYANIRDIQVNTEIGTLMTNSGKVKQVFLSDAIQH